MREIGAFTEQQSRNKICQVVINCSVVKCLNRSTFCLAVVVVVVGVGAGVGAGAAAAVVVTSC